MPPAASGVTPKSERLGQLAHVIDVKSTQESLHGHRLWEGLDSSMKSFHMALITARELKWNQSDP